MRVVFARGSLAVVLAALPFLVWRILMQESSMLTQVQDAMIAQLDGGKHVARIASNALKAANFSSIPVAQLTSSRENKADTSSRTNDDPTQVSQSTLNQAEEETIEASRQAAYEKYFAQMLKPLLRKSVPFAHFSHVRYIAHAGLGHRLVRQASAVYVGRLIGFAVRGYWSNNEYSNHTKEIFSEMFEPFTREDFPFVHSTNRTIKFGNEVPHMLSPRQSCGTLKIGHCKQVNTRGVEGPDCGCTFDEIQVHTEFYRSLREKYVRRQLLTDFMEKHKYSEHTVFGIHIRAGNGEQKDFTYKNRGVHHDATEYVSSLIKVMRETIPMDSLEKPPMIFLATDDPTYRTVMANEIQKLGLSWPVVVLEQDFAEEGVILHGGNANYEKWHSMFQDMVLLSHSDVLIAAKYSSFTQALPIYLVLDRPASERKLRDNYCEVIDNNDFGMKNGAGPELSLFCYYSYMQNCCGTENIVHRKVTKFLEPKWRGKDLELELKDFSKKQYFSFENSLGRFA